MPEEPIITRRLRGRDATSLEIPWEAMLCYLPVFCLYPWSLRREMPEIAGHVRQGMILFAFELGLFLITVPAFYKLVWLAILVIAGLGIWSAYNGRSYRLPVLTDLVEKLNTTPVEDSGADFQSAEDDQDEEGDTRSGSGLSGERRL